jgi:hypothetical protein
VLLSYILTGDFKLGRTELKRPAENLKLFKRGAYRGAKLN